VINEEKQFEKYFIDKRLKQGYRLGDPAGVRG